MATPRVQIISPRDVLVEVIKPIAFAALDVRSESEFLQGSIAGFVNLPILNNQERHLVGLSYKNEGQAAAIALGHDLVAESRDQRIARWVEQLKNAEHPFVTCWRGGLRSELASEWIAAAGQKVARVEGGYKALRSALVATFDHLPETLVLAGATGSGKTQMLKELSVPKVDLEKIALHRGSAFGAHLNLAQPAQASFENNLALEFRRAGKSAGLEKVLIEDESLFIGRVYLPAPLHGAVSQSGVVKIKAEIGDRVARLYDEYVAVPIQEGHLRSVLSSSYQAAILRIRNRLGGLHASTIGREIKRAFEQGETELHHLWIKNLLTNYYDKLYEYSFAKNPRKILFQGDWQECKSWIQKQFD